MSEETVFAPSAITDTNLARLAEEESVLCEQRLLELCDTVDAALDVAESLRESELDAYEILALLDGGLSAREPRLSALIADEDIELVRRTLSAASWRDRAYIGRLLSHEALRRGLPFTEGELLSGEREGGDVRVVYVRNAYSDEAFDVLSQELTNARVKYSSTFRECVEAVASGNADICLLPLEERGGVRVSTVSELIYRYDLRISAVTPVFGYDGLADLKYAALSRRGRLPTMTDGDDRYIELRIGSDGATSLAELLYVAAIYGMSTYRVNTMTFNIEGDERSFYSVLLRDEVRDITALLTYLTLFVDDYTVVGVYKNIE